MKKENLSVAFCTIATGAILTERGATGTYGLLDAVLFATFLVMWAAVGLREWRRRSHG